jgi:hypothetical protein
MKIILSVIVIFFLSFLCSAQTFTLYGDKTFGGNLQELYVNIALLDSNKLILAGRSATTNASGDKSTPNCNSNQQSTNSDVWIVMIDKNFNIIWDNSYGGERTEDGVNSIIINSNKEIMFSCRSSSDSLCEKTQNNWNYPMFNFDYWICKIDTNGNKLWDITFGGIGTDNYPYLIALTTNEYLIVGYSVSSISGDKSVANYGGSDLWAVKFDTIGNKLWDQVYGGSAAETHNASVANNTFGLSVLPLELGSFIIGSTTESQMSGNVSGLGFGGRDIWLMKADSAGNYLWDARYGGSTNNDFFSSFISTPDNGFIIVGATGSPQGGSISDPQIGDLDVWIIKLDSLGNKQWDKRYGGTGEDYGISISEAPGGGYWVSADTKSPQGFDISEPPYGTCDYWIFKIDSVGNKIWDKRFGGPGNNRVSNFVIMPDSSIFLAGYADVGESPVKTDFGKGMSDYWVVHFKYPDYSVGVIEDNFDVELSIFPNPSTGEVSVSFTLKETKEIKIELYNSLGQNVKTVSQQKFTTGKNQINFSTENFSKGIYHIKFSIEDDVVTRKLVKM